MSQSEDELEDLVREVAEAAFGFDDLRAGQKDAATAVLAGRDVLAVMPTGSGKSLIYQLSGALISGTTIVVSPLIALQYDQVDGIGGRLGGAAQVNSTLTVRQRAQVLKAVQEGNVEFVFVAPEQLANDETFQALKHAQPTLFVVDEAHCISAWGHDFRPEYLRLGSYIEALGDPQIVALTATAAPPVRREIVEQLGMRDPAVVVSDFERPNIWLEVERAHDPSEAHARLVDRIAGLEGTGLVYVATRRQAEDLAHELAGSTRDAAAYHAGMPASARQEVHERFLDPAAFVVVATIAFGMGIDVPHVRFVVHAEPPESLDAYYQEFGRAGRDGDTALALLFHPLEGGTGRRFFGGAADAPDELVTRAADVVAAGRSIDVEELAEVMGVSGTQIRRILDLLAATGALALDGDGNVRWKDRLQPSEAAAQALRVHETYRTVERTRAEMMRRYLETSACRWRTVLAYFGQPGADDCGHCDNCAAATGSGPKQAAEDRPFPLGGRVAHAAWGQGEVVAYEDDTMTVLFDNGGYRTLSVTIVTDKGLLRPV